ncbi:MAG: UDP-N-acetylmuramate dehydrogenase [Terrimonas sp.]|nr:UDP-N-acetylmuramate dehydrogenase [Terrimonas sp.]
MQIQENISLKPLNSFGIDVRARYFSAFDDIDQLEEILSPGRQWPASPLILGGGSNILFTKDVEGLVLKNNIKGIAVIHEDAEHVYVKAGAGENWHQFVQYCIGRNWAGLENLSLIPGNVGASPMQNIGAYGVELRDVFLDLEAFHIGEKRICTFTNFDCEFGYRDSVFKKKYKDQFVIINVTFRLRKRPILHTSYGSLEQELDRMGVTQPDIRSVAQAVINIRSSKLPDPKKIGNAGSFFKNPEVALPVFEALKNRFPGIVGYPLDNGNVKLAAGWLIEQCGWKGYRKGDAGCHDRQALVLVNYGNARGADILQLSQEIQASVLQQFSVTLNTEVNIF